jgi:16S rRNA (adenine1518-N6/adenine1519-N6)-dimethyltransferase
MVRLGQNFLVDRNILAVIERLAELGGDDVVLEVGGGQGILSRRLAAVARYVHVVELDHTLEDELRAELEPFANVALHMGDAMNLDLTALEPAPDKMVANLPYSIAASLILRTIEQLEGVQLWLVMVQREVGERLAARPGTPAYGAPSALAQVACEVKVVRAIPRTVFRPTPRVDSVLLRLRRRRPGAGPALRALINDSFAHRRKTLAGSLALASGRPDDIRRRAQDALTAVGHRPDTRAERLSSEQFVELARVLENTR